MDLPKSYDLGFGLNNVCILIFKKPKQGLDKCSAVMSLLFKEF